MNFKHTFIREKSILRKNCTLKFVQWFEYSEEEQEAVRNSRRKKCRATLPKIKKLNDKNSRELFEWLLQNNFGKNDYHLTLTFAEPIGKDQAKRELSNYIRRIRRIYKKQKVELKYLAVTEGAKDGVRLHFHLVISGGVSREIVENQWKLGYANADRLKVDAKDGLCALSKYLMKSQKTAEKNERSWTGSGNLTRPDIVTDDNAVSRKRMKKVQEAQRNDEVKMYIETIYKGFSLVDYEIGVNEVTGRPYARFKMIRSPSRKNRKVDRL